MELQTTERNRTDSRQSMWHDRRGLAFKVGHRDVRGSFQLQLSSSKTAGDLVALLRRVSHKDRQAFADLYAATSGKLYGVILRIVTRREVADELLQEAFVKIWERAADFDPSRASPITWMATIARNRALDEARKAKPLSLEDMPAGFDVVSEAPLALDLLMQSEEGRRLHDCLQRLDAEKRDVVVQAYLHGLSREDLGRRFDRPVPTIKTWLHRSLAQLKGCLTP